MNAPPDQVDATLAYANAEDPATVAFGFLVLRLLGIWFSLNLLSAAGFMATAVLQPSTSPFPASQYWGMAIPPAVLGVVGVLVAVFALPLARRLFRIPGGASFVPPPTETLLAILTVAIGVYLTADSIFNGVGWLIEGLASIRANLVGVNSIALHLTNGTNSIGQFAVGLTLFLRPRWVVGAWRMHSRMP